MSVVQSVWNSIVSTVQNYLNQCMSVVQSVWNSIVSAISGKVNEILGVVGRMGSEIIGKVSSWFGEMVNAGRNLIQGMIDGVKQMAGNLINAVAGPVNDAIGKAKSILGIHSPSRVFRQIGIYTGQGFILGVGDMETKVQSSMAKLVAPPASPSIPAAKAYTATAARDLRGPHNRTALAGGGSLTVNVVGQEEMSPDRFGRRVGESLAHALASGGVSFG